MSWRDDCNMPWTRKPDEHEKIELHPYERKTGFRGLAVSVGRWDDTWRFGLSLMNVRASTTSPPCYGSFASRDEAFEAGLRAMREELERRERRAYRAGTASEWRFCQRLLREYMERRSQTSLFATGEDTP